MALVHRLKRNLTSKYSAKFRVATDSYVYEQPEEEPLMEESASDEVLTG